MKRSIIILCLILATSAWLSSLNRPSEPKNSPFSVAGVTLGMTANQVEAVLGHPEFRIEELHCYSQKPYDVFVLFDKEGQVVGVSGSRLELHSVDFTPVKSNGPLAPELWAFLGEPDWTRGERRDLVRESGYDQYHLVLQAGCTGWSFCLGEPW